MFRIFFYIWHCLYLTSSFWKAGAHVSPPCYPSFNVKFSHLLVIFSWNHSVVHLPMSDSWINRTHVLTWVSSVLSKHHVLRADQLVLYRGTGDAVSRMWQPLEGGEHIVAYFAWSNSHYPNCRLKCIRSLSSSPRLSTTHTGFVAILYSHYSIALFCCFQ